MKRHSTRAASDTGVPAWWEPLLQASAKTSIFLSEAWLKTWLEVYGRDFKGHWVYWEEGGVVVGGCLLVKRTVSKKLVPFSSLYLNATGEAAERTPLAEFNDILCLRGYEEAIAADFLLFLSKMSWDRLLVSGYEENGLLGRLVARFPEALVERESSPAAYIDLTALANEPFESSLSSNTRNQIRRSRRLYEDRSGQITITLAGSLDEASRFLEEAARLHGARWQLKGEKGSFASPAYFDFHRRLIPRLWSKQAVDFIRVSAGESVIGYLYNFTALGKVYFFQSGFVYEADPKLKPGLLAHSLAIELYRSKGFREYDFLAGDAQYKRSLAKQHRTLYWTVIYRDRIWIRFLLWIRKIKARHLARRNCTRPGPENVTRFRFTAGVT
jgi:hypothetical protein